MVNGAFKNKACIILHRLGFTNISRQITGRTSISVRKKKLQKLFASGDWFWCFSYLKVRFLLSLWIYCECVLNLGKCQYVPPFPIYCRILLMLCVSLHNWWKVREKPSTVLNVTASYNSWRIQTQQGTGVSQKVGISCILPSGPWEESVGHRKGYH